MPSSPPPFTGAGALAKNCYIDLIVRVYMVPEMTSETHDGEGTQLKGKQDFLRCCSALAYSGWIKGLGHN